MKILIVRLGAMGDILHTLPALEALPDAEIHWIMEPRWISTGCRRPGANWSHGQQRHD